MAHFRLASFLPVAIQYSLLRDGVYFFCRQAPIHFQATHGKFVRECIHAAGPLHAAKPVTKQCRHFRR